MTKAARNAQTNAFAGLGDILGASELTGLMEESHQDYSMVRLDEITIKEQDRKEFEDAEQTLADLAADIKKRGVLQPVLLRNTADGYVLVAGERRVRASKIAELERIPAIIRTMTDDEAQEAQFVENTHRKNLTQIEEAARIQREVDELGSVDAFLSKYNKNRSWLSKTLSLLKLPEESRRLVTENISADLEVISRVRQVEKQDPQAARDLVDTLKATRGKVDARKTSDAALKKAKPKKAAQQPAAPVAADTKPAKADIVASNGFADAKNGAPVFSPTDALDAIHAQLARGESVKKTLASLQEQDRAEVGAWLYSFYDAGQHAMKAKGTRAELLASAVLKGLADNQFAHDGAGALALAAFLHGTDVHAEYDLSSVLKAAATSSK
ncbi:ParB/RepB/Spo0J family partition protein [Paraburkholderia largidicola]|uniref:ParB-like N-terminal domain-containing protein n=1 Tax=Paraburkholderia largidicola TaxID=3014751 RepID=A0A7I8C2U6_9BURK|nr:ParB/RepB/Spo0J family partition protein [Paraburkholderia sp. PGU16]BCF95406.1 hypothetical protein PPGU16_84730 [Paraburkholderia sp. PGU16]